MDELGLAFMCYLKNNWSLFSLFLAVQAENKDALYFVGLFRVANIEFLPEYRQKESKEFLSVAQNVQRVVRWVGCSASNK